MRASADELSALAPEAGEEAALAAERALMMNASRIGEDVSAASDALSGERGAEASLAVALKRLSRLDPGRAAVALGGGSGAGAGFRQYRRRRGARWTRSSPSWSSIRRCSSCKEERLFALRAAARKYGVDPDRLPDVLAQFEAKREAVRDRRRRTQGRGGRP